MSESEPLSIAKVIWQDPDSGQTKEFVLMEGATVSIGRASSNDIFIPERHVSRQHAVIAYRDGIFMINDLGSANGTFINDEQLTEAFPLASGDVIRLYVPELKFSAAVSDDDTFRAREAGTLITATGQTGLGRLIITTGPQEGEVIVLKLDEITIGRATTNYTWEIGLQDPSVSRPHAQLKREGKGWRLLDLNSSNGTLVNNDPVLPGDGCVLQDGDIILMGATLMLFRGN